MRRLLLLFLVISTVSCSTGVEQGTSAPPISGMTEAGVAFDLSDLKGSYVLIDFWGTWCGPCLHEAPSLVTLYHDFQSREFSDASGFEVVSVALEKNEGRTMAVAEKFGFDWPYQIVEESRFVRSSDLASAYGVTDIPAHFLISPDGEIVFNKADLGTIRSYLESKEK